MVNNFEPIANFISGKAKLGEFYFLQLLKRRKDNPTLEKGMILVDNFFIKDSEDLLKKQERIIEICTTRNARAYFRLNKRNEKKVALETLALIARNIANGEYNIRNCYHSVCGEYHSDEEKKWLIDIDWKDFNLKDAEDGEAFLEGMRDYLSSLQPKGEILLELPTKNGVHLITSVFRLDRFMQHFPKITVHKDNPTILFTP